MGKLINNSKLLEAIDDLRVRLIEFFEKYKRVFLYPTTLFRWLLFSVPPYFIGKALTDWYETYFNQQTQISSQVLVNEIGPILYFIFFVLLLGLGTFWRIKNSDQEKNEVLIYYALRWLYNDLGFDKSDADVRCTIWIPKDSSKSAEKMRLIQAVDYIPKFGSVSGQINSYRKNRNAGRNRRVARIIDNEVKPIGLIGNCAIETMAHMKPIIKSENLHEGTDFVSHMISVWNFTKAEANRLTKDRRAYMCISLMNAAQTDLLGIIFLDARTPNFFTEQVGDKAQEHLPRIAEALVAK